MYPQYRQSVQQKMFFSCAGFDSFENHYRELEGDSKDEFVYFSKTFGITPKFVTQKTTINRV